MFAVVLATLVLVNHAIDLPQGAVMRFGDCRYRGGVDCRLAISPDGKQFATWFEDKSHLATLTIWDSATGLPVRTTELNGDLFKGFVWNSHGAFAFIDRGEPNGKRAKIAELDFRVWDFTNPKSVPPLLPRHTKPGYDFGNTVLEARAQRYLKFLPSADGRRVVAKRSAANDKHTYDVFEL